MQTRISIVRVWNLKTKEILLNFAFWKFDLTSFKVKFENYHNLTSHDIQNELIKIITILVLKQIHDESLDERHDERHDESLESKNKGNFVELCILKIWFNFF